MLFAIRIINKIFDLSVNDAGGETIRFPRPRLLCYIIMFYKFYKFYAAA